MEGAGKIVGSVRWESRTVAGERAEGLVVGGGRHPIAGGTGLAEGLVAGVGRQPIAGGRGIAEGRVAGVGR